MTSRLSISLGNLAANYQLLCKHNQGPVAAVVKADGYGLGAVAIAQRLLRERCDSFFVATPQEGADLRSGLGSAEAQQVKIYVLSGVYPEVLPLFTNHNLTPVLNTADQIQTWSAVKRPAALHFDSLKALSACPLMLSCLSATLLMRMSVVIRLSMINCKVRWSVFRHCGRITRTCNSACRIPLVC